jgi:phosphatidylglycerophosphate synthase
VVLTRATIENLVPARNRSFFVALAAAGLALAPAAAALGVWPVSLPLYALVAALVWRGRGLHPHAAFGPANALTLGRAVLASLGAGLAVAEAAPPSAWWLIAGAGACLALDGIDGQVARRRGEASDLGARFDGEVDALVTLVLSLLVWRAGGTGAHVLGVGLMRYLMLLTAAAWPRLRGHVPSSLRAKIIHDANLVALLVCLAPPTPTAVRAPLAAAALAALVYSFSHDVRYLLARDKIPAGTYEESS